MEDLTDRLVDLLHRGELDIVLLALPYDCGPVEAFILFEDLCVPKTLSVLMT